MNIRPNELVSNPEELLALTPMGNLRDLDMVTQGTIFHGFEESAYSSGIELVIDGGYTVKSYS